MRNCIILGAGRSGTSMVAGLFQHTGYFMGSRLMATRPANPRGFFEDLEVNGINEELLASVTPRPPRGPLRLVPAMRRRPSYSQRWLAMVPLNDRCCTVTPAISARIQRQVAHAPYCFKDPRFCYTLPSWRPFLDDPVFLCVFRDPRRTAQSMVREVREARYLQGLTFSYADGLRVWALMYRHVLERHRFFGNWLFVHYDRVADGSSISVIEDAVGARLDSGFPDHAVSRTKGTGYCPSDVEDVYNQLLDLSVT